MKPAEPSQRQALLFLCHRSESGFIARFKALEKAFKPYGDTFFVYDASHAPVPDLLKALRHFAFSRASLDALSYPRLHDELMPGHVHFPMLDFALQHPAYAHYWVIEYDVRLTAPWRLFFRLLQRSKADFIGTHLRRYAEQRAWYWWPSFSAPDQTVDVTGCVRFFGPIYRISRLAVELVDARLKSGYKGHQEVVLPTLIASAGLSLQDLTRSSHFGCSTRWSWYTHQRADRAGYLAKSSMRFRPPMDNAGMRPFTLYHPVKSAHFGHHVLLDMARRMLAALARPMRRNLPQPDELK
jgi:hypothetical protein